MNSRSRSRSKSPIVNKPTSSVDSKIPIKKCFISKTDPLGQRSEEEIRIHREKFDIHIRYAASACPPPYLQFTDCIQLQKQVQEVISKQGFKQPSPIQSQSWPIILNGNDMIGIAETGSGKTLAFLVPAMIHIQANIPIMPGTGPLALILAPTRELACQTMEQFQKFGGGTGLKGACVYGGQPKHMQMRQFQGGCDLIVACPGRLNDFLDQGLVSVNRVTFLVLDEADRMLDMGFEPQIRRIIARMRSDRQTVLFSATWPNTVQQLAREFCCERPIHLQIGLLDVTANSRITQIIHVLKTNQKRDKVIEILKTFGPSKYLIFCSTKRGCEQLNYDLNSSGYKSMSLHGDKTQEERDYSVACFRDGRTKCLIATDVAQRGLDVKDVQYVVNYDMTTQIEDYVHRIGRTGRAGQTGTSITLFNEDQDGKIAKPLVDFLKSVNQQVPDKLIQMSQGGGNYQDRKDKFDERNYQQSHY